MAFQYRISRVSFHQPVVLPWQQILVKDLSASQFVKMVLNDEDGDDYLQISSGPALVFVPLANVKWMHVTGRKPIPAEPK